MFTPKKLTELFRSLLNGDNVYNNSEDYVQMDDGKTKFYSNFENDRELNISEVYSFLSLIVAEDLRERERRDIMIEYVATMAEMGDDPTI